MPICTIAATRCTRMVWRPPPPTSSLSAGTRLGRLKRTSRQQSEEHAHQQAQSRRDRDIDGVEIDLSRDRRADPPSRDGRNTEQHKPAERGACKRQQHRFEEQMLDETSPVSAERGADAQLTLAGGAADHHHARDVQAHDEEHRSRQAEQDADHASRLRTTGRTLRVVRLDGGRLELVRRGISLRQTRDRRRDKPIRPRDVDAWVEPAVACAPSPHVLSSRRFGFAFRRGCRSRGMNTREPGAWKKWKWPRKSSGAIPTTVCGTPSTVTDFPMMSGSDAIRLRQKSWLKTTRGSADGASSIAGANPGPRASETPNVLK